MLNTAVSSKRFLWDQISDHCSSWHCP